MTKAPTPTELSKGQVTTQTTPQKVRCILGIHTVTQPAHDRTVVFLHVVELFTIATGHLGSAAFFVLPIIAILPAFSC